MSITRFAPARQPYQGFQQGQEQYRKRWNFPADYPMVAPIMPTRATSSPNKLGSTRGQSEAHIAPALLALSLTATGKSARTSSGPSIPLRACNRTLRPTARGNGIRVGHRKGHSFGTDLQSRAAAHVNANGEAWLGPAQGTFSYRRAKPSPSDHIRPRVDPGGQVQ